MTLDWKIYCDENGNTAWRAAGPYNDTNAEWRLEPELRDDCIVWLARHTEELSESHRGDFWTTIENAKREIEKAHANVLADCTDLYEDEE